MVFAMVVIGGLGSIPGALLGAFYVRGVTWALPVDWQILATGAGLLVVLLVFPGGLGAVFADLRDVLLRRVARRRGLSRPGRTGAGHRVVRPRRSHARVRRRRRSRDRGARRRRRLRRRASALRRRSRRRRRRAVVALLGTNGSGKSTAAAGGVRSGADATRHDHGRWTRGHRRRARTHRGDGRRARAGRRGRVPVAHRRRAPPARALARARQARRRRRHPADALARFPVLGERGCASRAGNLSGGEQQLLTLAMAFVARPQAAPRRRVDPRARARVAETVVAPCRICTRRGTTIVVVEQSVDLALGIADRVYFMEQGEVRFAAPPADLLERPDLVRAVFLGDTIATRVRPPSHATRRRSSMHPGSTVDGIDEALRRHRRARRACRSRSDQARSSASRAERRGQDHAVRRRVRVHPRRRGDDRVATATRPSSTSHTCAARACAARRSAGRSRTAACSRRSPSPRRSRSRSSTPCGCATRSPPRCTCPRCALGGGRRATRRRARRLLGPRGVRRQVRARAVDRHPPDRRPRVRARARAVGAAPRRAVERHRAARGRGAGAAARDLRDGSAPASS